MAPSGYLRPEEEEWQPLFNNLCERFGTFPPQKIAQILRDNDGHAGHTSAALRDLSGTTMRPVDPDDAEHVRTLLSSPVMFKHACTEHFKKYDRDGNGVLEWDEILGLTGAIHEALGLQPPREGGLRKFFEDSDENGDGVLTQDEFVVFFQAFLKFAYLEVEKHGSKAPPMGLDEAPAPRKRHEHREHREEPRSVEKVEKVSKHRDEPREHRAHRDDGGRRERDDAVRAHREPRDDGGRAPEREHRAHRDEGGRRERDYRDDAGRAHREHRDDGGRAGGDRRAVEFDMRGYEDDAEDSRPAEREHKVSLKASGRVEVQDEWKEAFANMCKRFPHTHPATVAEVLKAENGHAGQVAKALRRAGERDVAAMAA